MESKSEDFFLFEKNDVDILGNFDKDQPTFIAKNVVNNSTRHPAVVAWSE